MSKSSRRGNRSGTRPDGVPSTAAGGPSAAQPASASPERQSVRPARPGATRAGRRERARPLAQPTLLERYRVLIVGAVVVAVVAVLAVAAFTSSSASAYSCTSEFVPGTTPQPGPDETGQPGYVQNDMGNAHVGLGTAVTYTYCPPATGSHVNVENRGPIEPRIYGPGDNVVPQGWIHNLEHGGLVVLYRGLDGDPGPTAATQAELRAFADALPDSPVCGYSPAQYLTIAQFDDMATPFAALVWGRVLPLESLDTAAIQAFWNTSGEQALTMPERFGCPLPGASPSPSAS